MKGRNRRGSQKSKRDNLQGFQSLPSQVHSLLNRLLRALGILLSLVQWRMAQTIAEAVGLDEATADAAIAYAIGTDWLIGGGSQPHSICLTDAGRVWTARLVK